jgi:hypothetical protein
MAALAFRRVENTVCQMHSTFSTCVFRHIRREIAVVLSQIDLDFQEQSLGDV